jgi:hypothetical protein
MCVQQIVIELVLDKILEEKNLISIIQEYAQHTDYTLCIEVVISSFHSDIQIDAYESVPEQHIEKVKYLILRYATSSTFASNLSDHLSYELKQVFATFIKIKNLLICPKKFNFPQKHQWNIMDLLLKRYEQIMNPKW